MTFLCTSATDRTRRNDLKPETHDLSKSKLFADYKHLFGLYLNNLLMVNWAVKGYPWGGTKPRYSSINTAGDDETFDNYTQSSLVHQHLFKVVGWTNFQGHWKISVALLMTIYRSIGQLALLGLAPHLAQSFPPWIDLLSPHKSVSHSEWLCKLYAQRGDLWGFLLWTVTYKKRRFSATELWAGHYRSQLYH